MTAPSKSGPMPLLLALATAACGTNPPELPTATTTTEATETSLTPPASTGGGETIGVGSSSSGAGNDTTGSPQSTDAGSSSSDTDATLLTEHLQNAAFSTCTEPLWCFADGSPSNPAGDPTHGQECFDAEITPPFVLRSVTVHIAQLVDQLVDVDLVVYAPVGLSPTEPSLYVEPVPVDALAEGANVIVLSETVVVPTSRVCVGLRSNGFGLSGALGMAIDTESQIPDVSYLSLMGPQACDVPTLTEVIGLAPMPSGNWCISAEIDSAPSN